MISRQGGCLCGAVRFRVAGDPSFSVICHCRSCRKASGAPSVAWLTFPLRHFALLRGALRDFASSPGVTRASCPICGTQITYKTEESPDSIDVATACLDEETAFPPTCETWLAHRLFWQPLDPALAHHEGSI